MRTCKIEHIDRFRDWIISNKNYPVYKTINTNNNKLISDLFINVYSISTGGINNFKKKCTDYFNKLSIDVYGKTYTSARAINYWIIRGWLTEEEIKDRQQYITSLQKNAAIKDIDSLIESRGLSKEDAIKWKDSYFEKKNKATKITVDNLLEKDPDWHKKNSRYAKEFWIKMRMSDENAIQKAWNETEKNRQIFQKNIRENPEDYNSYTETQLKYWVKKGYSEEEALIKLTERQTTFSKEICIEKYGEIEGLTRWQYRQEKWLNNYKRSNFSKVSQELFWKIYNLIDYEKNAVFFATLKNGLLDDSGKNNEYRLKLDTCVILPDFYIQENKKIIEFDGSYYHRNTPENATREDNRDINIKASGFFVLHITEAEYKKNPVVTVKKCLNFLENE